MLDETIAQDLLPEAQSVRESLNGSDADLTSVIRPALPIVVIPLDFLLVWALVSPWVHPVAAVSYRSLASPLLQAWWMVHSELGCPINRGLRAVGRVVRGASMRVEALGAGELR